MESSAQPLLLDQLGRPLPERIQRVLGELAPRLQRKFSLIRDEVVLVEILEQAGCQIVNHEAQQGPIERLHGFAWVTVRNVAISRLRRGPYLLERSMVSSAEREAVFARLTAEEGSPKKIHDDIYLDEVLKQVSMRERKIAIWKKSGIDSRLIAERLGMTVSSVDTTYFRLRQRVQKLLGPGFGMRR